MFRVLSLQGPGGLWFRVGVPIIASILIILIIFLYSSDYIIVLGGSGLRV